MNANDYYYSGGVPHGPYVAVVVVAYDGGGYSAAFVVDSDDAVT